MMKIVYIIITLILGSCLPAFSEIFIENGIAYYVLKDGTLSVTHKQKDGWALNSYDKSLTYKGDVKIPAEVVHKGKRYKVSEIGSYAFYFCDELTSVSLPEGLKRICEHAFDMNYGSLKSLHIPASVSKLEPGFVIGLWGLSDIKVSPQNKYYRSEGNCIYDKNMTTLILVSPKLLTYKFPPTVTTVVDYAMFLSSVKKLVIPSSLKFMGGKAFSVDINVICKHNLKKIPGSKQHVKGMDLPEWATGH